MRRLAAAVLAALAVSAGGAVLISYELTPTPVLGHRDPHAAGAAAVAQDFLAAGDSMIGAASGAAAPAPPPAPTTEAPRRGLWIEIPQLTVALPVARGDGSDRIPMWEALVYPGTAWPGTVGNSYLYAHGYWGMFGGLLYARLGDRAYLHDYDTGRVAEFRVSRVIGRVAYNDSRWMTAGASRPTLTLQTCVDYNPKGDRFLVQLS